MNAPHLPRFCKRCGALFYARRWSAEYCSGACRQADYRLRNRESGKNAIKPEKDVMTEFVTCCTCDAKFWLARNGTHALYCSAKCRQKAYRLRVKRGIDAWGRVKGGTP